MAITVKQNKPGGYVVVNTTGTDFLSLNSATAGKGANGVGETVQSMTVVGAKWSVSGTNTWTISRGAAGANSTIAVLAGSGQHDYDASQMKLESTTAHETSNVVFALSGGSGTLLLKVHKVSGE